MNDAIYDDTAIERLAKTTFGLSLEIKHIIARQIPVSHTAEATVFLTSKNQLFVLINAKSRLLLGDVRKLVIRMGLQAEIFIPPNGEQDYFDRIGRDKFKEVFPGRTNVAAADIAFYRTLAPYNPALVQILEIKDGVIKKFDPDSSNAWRVATEFSYRRIRTS